MPKRKAVCEIPACDEEATVAGLCRACYSGLYYWRGATPKELLDRRRKLKRLESRMELKLGNVTDLPAKRRRRAS